MNSFSSESSISQRATTNELKISTNERSDEKTQERNSPLYYSNHANNTPHGTQGGYNQNLKINPKSDFVDPSLQNEDLSIEAIKFLSFLMSKEMSMFISQLLIRFSYTSLDVTLHLFKPAQASILLSTGTLFYACSKFFSGFLIDNYLGGIFNLRLMFLIGFVCLCFFYIIYPQNDDHVKVFFAVISWNLYRGASCSSWASIGKVIDDRNFFSWLGMASKLGTILGMITLGYLMKFIGLQVWFLTGIILGIWSFYLYWNKDLKDFRNFNATYANVKDIKNTKESRNIQELKDLKELNQGNTDSVNEEFSVKKVPSEAKLRKDPITLSTDTSSYSKGNNLGKENDTSTSKLKTETLLNHKAHPLDGKPTIDALKYFLVSTNVYYVAVFMTCATVLTELQSHFSLFFMNALEMEPTNAVVCSSAFSFGFVISILLVGFLYITLEQKKRSWYLVSHFSLSLISIMILAFFEIQSPYIASLNVFFIGFGLAPTYYVPYSSFCAQYGGKFSATLMGLIDTVSFGSSVILHANVEYIALLYGWQFVFKILTCVAIAGILSLFAYVFSDDVKI